jgi:hypothetical protein
VAQDMVGAGPCFILVSANRRHFTDLFRKNSHLIKKPGIIHGVNTY